MPKFGKIKVPSDIKTVLVTGASSGIGRAYVSQFAQLGLNCVLVSKQQKELNDTAFYLQEKYKVKTWTICQDLSIPNAAQDIFDFCQEQGIQIDILMNNAGVLLFERLSKLKKKQISNILNLHVYTVTFLTYLFGKEMLKRKKGFIINVSSFSAWATLPGLHLYNSTKRYIRDFSHSIYYEFRKHNIGVSTICPSGVNTPFFTIPDNLRSLAVKLGLLISPELLVKRTIKKVFRFKKDIFPRVSDYLFTFVMQHLPDSVIFWVMRKLPQFKENDGY